MNNQNGNYSGISSPPLYNMNLSNQNKSSC